MILCYINVYICTGFLQRGIFISSFSEIQFYLFFCRGGYPHPHPTPPCQTRPSSARRFQTFWIYTFCCRKPWSYDTFLKDAWLFFLASGGDLLQKPFVHIAYFITTKEKRGDHTSDERKKGEKVRIFIFIFSEKTRKKWKWNYITQHWQSSKKCTR